MIVAVTLKDTDGDTLLAGLVFLEGREAKGRDGTGREEALNSPTK